MNSLIRGTIQIAVYPYYFAQVRYAFCRADFHTLQVLEASISMAQNCQSNTTAIEHLFIGTARQLDALSPTPRKFHKIALTAEKFEKGVNLF